MIVQTSRFGAVEVDATRIISFGRGILGFPKYKDYVLIEPEADSTFYWLQSVDAADLAFVVTDPLLFVPDYQVPLREETRQELNMKDLAEANVLVIVNKVGDTLTANLQGPLVIHAQTRAAAQIVISEKKYQTRHPILQLQRPGKPAAQPAAATAQYVSKSA
ncbi:MAG TPA: flagellar assembly protein FliW [Phycisphaerae bacterium]|jgi:flagellar assembly factor FliW|nr:flagellar assembly protein FliW [Phycisphaerae bacterium]